MRLQRGSGLVATTLAVTLGCTSITVEPVPASEGLRRVCIERNPKVEVRDFLEVVQAGFQRHGIGTQVFDGPMPGDCEFVLKYTALRSWDIVAFLSHAELQIERSGKPVASAIYHLRGKGGYSFDKYGETKEKMDPVIEELLAQYRPSASSP